MTNKNKESTRYYSTQQEKDVAKKMKSQRTPNSGASTFSGGDCINRKASLLIECKTAMTEKDSFSIKKNWITKNREEKFSQRLSNSCIAFSFGPEQENFFIIDEKLMRYLVEKLEEDNE